MKLIAASLLVALAIAPAVQAEAQTPAAGRESAQPSTPKLIDINPLDLVFGQLSVEFEHALSSNLSLVIGPQALLFVLGGTSGESVSGGGLSLGLHYFPGSGALHGFWLGPEVDLRWVSVTLGTASGSGGSLALAGILGYTFFPGAHVPISIGLGAGYQLGGATATDSATGSTASIGASGLALTGRLAVGYAW